LRENASVFSKQEVLKIFKFSKQALERAEYIYTNSLSPDVVTTTETEEINKPKIPERRNQPFQIETKNSKVPQGQINGSVSYYQPKPLNVQSPIPRDNFQNNSPTLNHQKSKSEPVPLNFNSFDIYHLENQKLSSLLATTSDPQTSTRLTKRYFENLGIQKQKVAYEMFLQEQENLRKKMEQEKLQKENQIRLRKEKGFAWSINDKWAIFIEKKLIYDMNSGFEEDLTWIEALTHSDAKREVIQNRLAKITSSNHPIGILISSFVSYLIQIHKLQV
jgi:hypothetical protein